MRKLLASSLMVIGTVSAVALATRAFFSDTETATGNSFTAGEIDLRVGNTSWWVSDGNIIPNDGSNQTPDLTWPLSDLNTAVFFNFADVKPGDLSEDTIALQVDNNDAWLCADISATESDENEANEPELDDGETADDPANLWDGELANELNFAFWADDGDNVFEEGEQILTQGNGSAIVNAPNRTLRFALADSTFNAWNSSFTAGPLVAGSPKYIGKVWCMGTLAASPATDGTGSPDDRDTTGFLCNGAGMTNRSQSDTLVGNVSFYAEQSRNNADFTCEGRSTVVSVDASNSNWFFYNDETDVIDPSLGSFVTGPAPTVQGVGSAEMSVSGTQRRNIATYSLSGTELADISTIKFSTYQPVSNPGSTNRAIYMHFNVDFDGSDTWQRRLVFVPSSNGVVQKGVWQEWDAINGGAAQWVYSGTTWPVTGQPGTTAKTWAQIKTDYPNARVRVTDAFWGFRAGEPYADGFTGNIDKFVFGINGVNTTYDFGN